MNRDALNALDQTVAIARARAGARVPVVGIAGPQGSGKTTLVQACAASQAGVAFFSLDDVYLSKQARQSLAMRVHPLFATRGPPGTHDVALFQATLDMLQKADPDSRTAIPSFDKVTDDVTLRSRWTQFVGRPNLILIDGWCLGAGTQDPAQLKAPVNKLEEREDPNAAWRNAVNDYLFTPYQEMFARLDAVLYLRPPGFEVVHDWRCQQEEGLLGRLLTAGDRTRIDRFIQHYERITRHMIEGGRRADIEICLDARRNVTEVRRFSQKRG
jgi:D-glycerate 3-kinase